MGTSAKLFRSSTGFISPYFIVDVEGNLMSKTVTVMGNRIELTNNSYISYNGQPLLTSTGLAASVTISPSGTGTVIIAPATTGSIDNITIGASTASTGRFTNVTITSLQQTNNSSAITKGYAVALSAAYGVALS